MSDKNKEILKEVGLFAAKTTAISVAILGGIAIAVPAAGFTAGGVAAGSLAAAFQSAYLGGTIASGSLFALLQSIGAAGLAASTQAAIVAASATAAGTHSVVKKLTKKKKCSSSKNLEEDNESNDDDEVEAEEDYLADEESDDKKLERASNKSNLSKNLTESTSLPSGGKMLWKKFVNGLKKDKNKAGKMRRETRRDFDEDEAELQNVNWKDVELTASYCNHTDEVTMMIHLLK